MSLLNGHEAKVKPSYIEIPYGDRDVWTPSGFAARFGLSKAKAAAVLRLYKPALKALTDGQSLLLPGFGTFGHSGGELHFTTPPKPAPMKKPAARKEPTADETSEPVGV